MSTTEAAVDVEQVKRAKAFLMKTSSVSNTNLYDHMIRILREVLDNQLENAVDSLEELSHRLKQERFQNSHSPHIPTAVYESPVQLEVARKIKPLFQTTETEEEIGDENLQAELSLPDMLELQFQLEQAGIGLPREEMFCVALALKQLVATHPIKNVRFWGKILGLEKNYIVAEAEMKDEETDDKDEATENEEKQDEEEEEERQQKQDSGNVEEKDKDGEQESHVPESSYKPPPVVPVEPSGVGVNKKVYFVCNEPGDEWIQLPNCTPAQIVTARKIKKYFTGNLNHKITSFPPFDDTEAYYLGTQIARISAGTQISPLGFYQFDDEGDDDDMGKTDYIENLEYEPVPIQDLIDPSMAYWVHHTANILTQGRTTWWNPGKKRDNEEEEEEEEAEDDMSETEAFEAEVGPPLLTPLSEDAHIESTPPWSVNLSSKLLPQHAVAVVQSNLWPGALAVSTGRNFQNVYIGWGLKYQVDAYSPEQPPPCWKEYHGGPEITEVTDPTPDEEAAYMAAQEEKNEEEEEEETEDSGDDDDY